MFIDISGFTKMSERLARKGKVGAEEVSGAIDVCFSELLEVSYRLGGSLLKFGGDALLLLFDGLEHPARAARAAWEMRQALRTVGKLETSAGKVNLRMSCGIHSGTLQFFLVGRSHRELLVTGPGSTRVAQMEAVAGSGEILVSPETAELLGQPASIGSAKGPGFLLKRSPSVSDFQPPELPRFEGDVSQFVPLAIREVILGGINEGEHRIVTVGFIHFGRVDEGLASGRTDEITEGLEKLVSDVQSIVQQEDIAFLASDVYPDGGKLILTAGAPLSSGNDEERMFRTLTKIKESRHDFPLRIGAYRGRVFSGEIGSPFRKTYTVMGDAVNMAARLMQRAQEGQLLTTEELLNRSRTKFHVTALESFLPKGKSDPVIPMAVDDALGQDTGGAGGSLHGEADQRDAAPALVGREAELETLLSLVEGQELSIVQIVGEAGSGKSSLLAEMLRQLERPFVQVSCEQYQSSTPYFTVGKLLTKVLGIEPDDTPAKREGRLTSSIASVAPDLLPLTPLLSSVLDAEETQIEEVRDLNDEFRKARLQDSIVKLLEQALESALVVVDDAHWMDPASSDVLNLLFEVGLSIIVVRRYIDRGFKPAGSSSTLELGPLNPKSREELIRRLDESRRFRKHEVEMIADRSGGNPLFLVELVRAVKESGEVDALPASVEALIASRIDRLALRDRRALRYASVMGQSFDPSPLGGAKINLDSGVWARLGDFVLLDSDARVNFRNELYRQTAYEGLSYRIRRQLHSEIGDLLAARKGPEGRPEILSAHFHLAHRHPESWKFSRLAGKRALSKWGFVEAARFLQRALQAAEHIEPPRSEVRAAWEELGICFQLTGQYDEAVKALLAGRAFVEDPVKEARLISRVGDIQRIAGNHLSATRWFNRGLRVIEQSRLTDAGTTRVRLLLGKAIVEQERGNLRRSLQILHLAEQVAEEEGDEAGLGHIYHFLHIGYLNLGDPRSIEYRGRAIPLFRRSRDHVQLGHALDAMGSDFYYNGEWNKARVYYEKSRRVRERAGDVLGQAGAANNTGEILSDQGFLDQAQELFNEALSIWVPARFELGIAFAIGNIGRLLTRAGELRIGSEKLKEAISRFERMRAQAFVPENKARLAENLTLAKAFSEAGEVIEELMPLSSQPGREAARLKAMILRLKSAGLASEGMIDEAHEALSNSISAAREWNIRFELAQSLKERGRLDRLRGMDPSSDEAEAARWFKKLGVINTIELPMPAPPPGV